jgi:hypothetical protein
MDAHFHEYLAAVAAMSELYGERGDDHPTEFHDGAGCHAHGEAAECGAGAVTVGG